MISYIALAIVSILIGFVVASLDFTNQNVVSIVRLLFLLFVFILIVIYIMLRLLYTNIRVFLSRFFQRRITEFFPPLEHKRLNPASININDDEEYHD